MTEAEYEKIRALRPVTSKPGAENRPIVLKYKKVKKKEASGKEASPQFSPELEGVQRLGSEALRVTHKATKAFEKSLDTYERERQKSASEKKDGALEDVVYNAGKATSVWLKETSDLPADITESVKRSAYGKRLRKRMRKVAKQLSRWQM